VPELINLVDKQLFLARSANLGATLRRRVGYTLGFAAHFLVFFFYYEQSYLSV